MILRLEIGSHRLSDAIFAFAGESDVLLPLSQLVDLLELPMTVDVEAGRTEGWVHDPDRTFALDGAAGVIQRQGVEQALPPDAPVEVHWDELYVGSKLLASWWSISFAIDVGQLRVAVSSPAPLAISRRLDRRERWARFGRQAGGQGSRRAGFPSTYIPYRVFDWPAIDANLDLAWRRSGDGELSRTARYSTLVQGDFLGMTTDLFWGGSVENGDHRISGRRLSFSRTDPDGRMLGLLGATEAQLGDLVGGSHPLITPGLGGRGVRLERDRGRLRTYFDPTTLRGDALPGWDVELYRNHQLVDFQTVGADGRYEFLDIPLSVGRNVLRVSMFGPHGETHERVERILVGARALPPGEVRYQLSLLESGRGLLGADGELRGGDFAGARVAGQGEMAFDASYERGLTRRWTASAGALSLPIREAGDPERHSYAWLAFEGSWLGIASRFEAIRDFDSGWACRLIVRRRIASMGLRLEHSYFSSFFSERQRDRELTGRTELHLDGRLSWRGQRGLPFSIVARHETRPNRNSFQARAELSYSVRLGSVRLANRWGLDVQDDATSGRGRSTFHSRWGRLPIRGRLAYDFWPRADLTQLNLEGRWLRGERLTTTFGLDYDLATQVASVRAGLEWQSRRHLLSTSLEAGSDGRLSLQLGTRFNFRHSRAVKHYRLRSDATAKQGVVEARVFLDGNGNGAFDPEDEPLSEVAFKVDGGRHAVTTDAEGVALLAVDVHRPADLTVVEATLEDPYWISIQPGFEVRTRPGRTELIEFPVVISGEIDGTIYINQGTDQRAIGGVWVELIDQEGRVMATAESQYDGFYLFERVVPGRYRLRISPEVEDRWGLEPPEPVDLEIGVDTVHSGIDFDLDLPIRQASQG